MSSADKDSASLKISKKLVALDFAFDIFRVPFPWIGGGR